MEEAISDALREGTMSTRTLHRLPFAAALTLVLAACGDGIVGPDQVQNATSQLCPNVRGARAIFWDIMNGVPRTDLPGNVPPTVREIGGDFFHPAYPPLSFIYPRGWAPQTVSDQQTVGVNLIRNDGRAVWRWIGGGVFTFVDPRQALDFEVQGLLSFLGAGGNVQVLCAREASQSPAPGVFLSNASVMFEVGGQTALVAVQISNVDGLNFSQVAATVAAVPDGEYDALIFDTFLAIGFQLLYGNSVRDSDGDGTPDPLDPDPGNPLIK